jgi:chromosome segregation protein
LQARIQQLETSMERVAERQRRLAEERALLAADPEDAAILALSEHYWPPAS